MSHDFDIWSVRCPSLPSMLPQAVNWVRQGESWAVGGPTWRIIVSLPQDALPEDIPPEVFPLLPGLAYLTTLNLEPLSAPNSARNLALKAAKQLARLSYGIVHDHQTGAAVLPSGTTRFPKPTPTKTISLVELTWWFLQSPLLSPEGPEALVGILEQDMPEAVPRRYGLFEPPQHLYEREGKNHFVRFLKQHMGDFVVWYPHRPVAMVNVLAAPSPLIDRRGFRANRFSISFDANALSLPGWEVAMRRLWHHISHFLSPFYGDVRTLAGYSQMSSTVGVGIEAEHHPVFGPWWNGVPTRLGHAIVLGAEYQALWPQARPHAQPDERLWICSTPSWADATDLTDLMGQVPPEIAQPKEPAQPHFHSRPRRYPPAWPLPGPYPSEPAPGCGLTTR